MASAALPAERRSVVVLVVFLLEPSGNGIENRARAEVQRLSAWLPAIRNNL
jgi:hypothetical protein